MKVAIVNFSGNVGKSTISRHLLAPRMNTSVIMVESVNADKSSDAKIIKGRQFGELNEFLMLADDAIIDIGASNVEEYMALMAQYQGSHEEFDIFIVPAVPESKQMHDSISTIHALSQLGVPPKRIRVIFNKAPRDMNVEETFRGLFDYHDAEGTFTLLRQAIMYESEIYEQLEETRVTIKEVLEDPINYKSLAKKTTDVEERLRLARRHGLRQLALGATKDLDSLFDVLFG
jgi:hypothetical protein